MLAIFCSQSIAQAINQDSIYFREHYDKKEYMVSMRDGVKLFTVVYSPKDKKEKYPFLMMRTPYSCAPYGEDNYPGHGQGPDERHRTGQEQAALTCKTLAAEAAQDLV